MKKKIFMILLACVLLVVGSIHCFALAEACSHSGGTTTAWTAHDIYGGSCVATEVTFCTKCMTIFDTYPITYSTCPAWHRRPQGEFSYYN